MQVSHQFYALAVLLPAKPYKFINKLEAGRGGGSELVYTRCYLPIRPPYFSIR